MRETIPLARPWFDESEALAAYEVVKSKWLFQGPQVERFEGMLAEMLGVKHAVAVNSGSSALLVALLALDIGREDEIIVPDMTFVSTASCALFTGARPRFADIELDYYGMDPGKLRNLITPRTKAILPVHYAGHTAKLDEILAIADEYGIPVIEDAAEALLSRYEGKGYAGTLGKAGIFSFTPSKPMTVGEGGVLITNDGEIAARARLARNFGDSGKFRWDSLGFNFRMMDIQGAIGICQLHKVRDAIEMRRAIGARYTDAFGKIPGLITPRVRHPQDMNFQLYTIRIDERLTGRSRDDLSEHLNASGVASRVYFPTLHDSGVFLHCEPGEARDYPNACEFAKTALSLPIFPTLSDEDIDHVIGSVSDFFGTRA